MSDFGRKADLARLLGISRSAVGQAFKKYNIQVGVDGTFNLKHVECILRDKQNQTISRAQRNAIKQPAGLKNPRVKREIVRSLWPIWDEAICTVIRKRAESGFENEQDLDEIGALVFHSMNLWEEFHRICEREYPADLGDFPYKKPDCINYNYFKVPMLEQIKKILGVGDLDE